MILVECFLIFVVNMEFHIVSTNLQAILRITSFGLTCRLISVNIIFLHCIIVKSICGDVTIRT